MLDLVFVSRVQKHEILALIEPVFKFPGLQPGSSQLRGTDVGAAHRDNLFFDLHEHPQERDCLGQALFRIERAEAGVRLQKLDERANFFRRPGERGVKALFADQNRSLESILARAARSSWRSSGSPLREITLERDVQSGRHNGRSLTTPRTRRNRHAGRYCRV